MAPSRKRAPRSPRKPALPQTASAAVRAPGQAQGASAPTGPGRAGSWGGSRAPPQAAELDHVMLTRQLFWQNVVRETLTSLSILAQQQPELFDGRLSLLTHSGDQIPIAEVVPLFACGLSGTSAEKALSMAVECTVFRVRTPDGEVYTLPLHEIRALHALTEDLAKKVEAAGKEAEEASSRPFGFAAFASLVEEERNRAKNAADEAAAWNHDHE